MKYVAVGSPFPGCSGGFILGVQQQRPVHGMQISTLIFTGGSDVTLDKDSLAEPTQVFSVHLINAELGDS